MKSSRPFAILALLFALADPMRANDCPFARLTASDWEAKYLRPATPETELEPQYKKTQMFYDMGLHLTGYLSSASFSNELPFSLVSDDVNQRRAERMRNATLWELLQLKDEPILSRRSLANLGIIGRNVLAVAEWIPQGILRESGIKLLSDSAARIFPNKISQFHKRPNMAYFDTFLPRDAKPSQLSEVGNWYKHLMPGRTFLDLASGDPRRAIANRLVAQRFGAADYVGVEMTNLPWRRTWRNEFPAISNDRGFTSRMIKNDILSFLRRLDRPGPLFIRLQGLEVLDTDAAEKHGHDYLEKVMQELQKVTKPGDVFSVGRVVSFFEPQAPEINPYHRGPDYTIDPARYGFRLVAGEPHEMPNGLASREFLWVRE